MSQYHYESVEIDRQAIPTGQTEVEFVLGIINAREGRGESFFMFYDTGNERFRTLIFKTPIN